MKLNKKPRALVHTDRIVSWTFQGLKYGYPPCCIGEFVIHAIKNTFDKRGDRKLTGTGYVPCIKCNELPQEELLTYIEDNRHHEQPFPNDD